MRMMRLIGLMLLALTLTACQSTKTPTTQPTNKVACEAFRIIPYHYSILDTDLENDTMATVNEIRGHNAAYRALCR